MILPAPSLRSLTPLPPSLPPNPTRTHIPTMSTSPHISPLHHPNQQATVVPPQAPLGSNGGQSANSPLLLPLPSPTSSLPPSPAFLCSYYIPDQGCDVLGSGWHPPATLASTRITQHPLPAPTSSLNMTADPTTSPLCDPPQPTTSPSTLPRPSRWVPRSGPDRRRCYRRGWRPSECVSALASRCGGSMGVRGGWMCTRVCNWMIRSRADTRSSDVDVDVVGSSRLVLWSSALTILPALLTRPARPFGTET